MTDCRIFSVRKQHNRSPTTGNSREFFVIDSPDWVNVVPVTAENELILVRQYRQGSDSITLEVPAGQIDSGDVSPLVAAQRELKEETGYESKHWKLLGTIFPNSAIQSNQCHIFLADSVEKISEQALDPFEEIEVLTVPMHEVPDLIRNGTIGHTLAITSLYLFGLSNPLYFSEKLA